ncbi:MAG: hypothetical protein IT271_00330 [Chitinophagales bacterium]|nr:hypothetical protein [Chitinophagales bacterium]
MMVIFLLTMLVVLIPALNVLNARSVQRIALFIGATQIALLAFAGKIDNQLSDILVNGFNHVVSFSYQTLIEKIVCLFIV